jgi:hypothetical protein
MKSKGIGNPPIMPGNPAKGSGRPVSRPVKVSRGGGPARPSGASPTPSKGR